MHTDGEQSKVLQAWSDFLGRSSPEKENRQKLMRKAPPIYMRPTPVNTPPPSPPTSTHDTRIDRIAPKHLQKKSDLYIMVA